MTSIFDSLHFSNKFSQLSTDFYAEVKPQPLDNPCLVSINPSAGALVGLDTAMMRTPEFLDCLSGVQLPSKSCSIATVYSGHQFGSYNPQLGDGRALLIADIFHQQKNHELQLKGSGMTPFSRMGDGRAVLRSSIREYLCSEAMHGLGIETTRALALASSTTPVYRETVETAATIIRMAPSHIRFGHFEYFFYTKQKDNLKTLVDFVISNYFCAYKDLPEKERYAHFLTSVVQKTAELIACWQAYGFCHGVMNTDNLSILGLTIDYGPFAFMDDFDIGHICNHSDHGGRYAFNKQIEIGFWNLNALAHSLSELIDIEDIRFALDQFEPTFLANYRSIMQKKLGLYTHKTSDDALISQLMTLLHSESLDYSVFFRELSHCSINQTPAIADLTSMTAWFKSYQDRVKHEAKTEIDRKSLMLSVNPKYILRNHLAQEAIEKAQTNDFSMVNALLDVLQAPFDEHDQYSQYALPPTEACKHIAISCSS